MTFNHFSRQDHFNTSPESDKIRKVKEDLESVKGTMKSNIGVACAHCSNAVLLCSNRA